MADSPSSELSSHASSEFGDLKTEDCGPTLDAVPDHDDLLLMPPAKRQRMGHLSQQSTPVSHYDPREDPGDISSDTSGDVPLSPPGEKLTQMQEDDPVIHEQVTVCRWIDCQVGELQNMDELVQHIHDEHIGTRQKNHVCEWQGCSRMNQNHASGYALKAHMRSHTREKPFYCALPECDRAFTRSDALLKHMRTVHETEALRPSDPIPRNHSSAPPKPQRLKLIFYPKPRPDSSASIDDDATIYASNTSERESIRPLPSHPFTYPSDIHFTAEEASMRPDRLFSLLRRRVHWAEQDGVKLREEVEALEAKRKKEWQAKELVLANVMEAELANAFQEGGADIASVLAMKEDLPHPMLPIQGQTPWYRQESEEAEQAEQAG